MFSLISGMMVYLFGIPQYNVLVLGLDNAGKSTFLYQVGNICDRHKKKKKASNDESNPASPPHHLQRKRKYSDASASDVDEEVLHNATLNNSTTTNDTESNHLYAKDPKLRQILPTMGQNVKILEFADMTLQFWDLPGQTGFRKIWTHYFNEAHAIVFMVDSADTERLSEARDELHKLLNRPELQYAPFLILANKQDLKQAVHYQSLVNTLQILTAARDSRRSNDTDTKEDSNCNAADDQKTPINSPLVAIDEHKQSISYFPRNSNPFRDRSMKVMCTCCLNKEGLSDAISWLVYSIPLAKKRVNHVAQFQAQQTKQNKQ